MLVNRRKENAAGVVRVTWVHDAVQTRGRVSARPRSRIRSPVSLGHTGHKSPVNVRRSAVRPWHFRRLVTNPQSTGPDQSPGQAGIERPSGARCNFTRSEREGGIARRSAADPPSRRSLCRTSVREYPPSSGAHLRRRLRPPRPRCLPAGGESSRHSARTSLSGSGRRDGTRAGPRMNRTGWTSRIRSSHAQPTADRSTRTRAAATAGLTPARAHPSTGRDHARAQRHHPQIRDRVVQAGLDRGPVADHGRRLPGWSAANQAGSSSATVISGPGGNDPGPAMSARSALNWVRTRVASALVPCTVTDRWRVSR